MNQATMGLIGVKDSHQRLVEIVSSIRVTQLGPAYLTLILPELWWVKRSGLDSHLRMAFYLAMTEGVSHSTILQGSISFPPMWRLPGRRSAGDIAGRLADRLKYSTPFTPCLLPPPLQV